MFHTIVEERLSGKQLPTIVVVQGVKFLWREHPKGFRPVFKLEQVPQNALPPELATDGAWNL